MYIYIIMLIISMIFAYIADKNKVKWKKIMFSIISTLPFIFISAFRYDVGTDYMHRNVPDFETLKAGGDVEHLEIGFKLMVRCIANIFKEPQSLFIITTLIIIPIIMYIIFKESKKPILSIFIFFTGCYFFYSLNIVRQYLAIALILVAYKYILDNSYKKFAIMLVLAFSIHYSSIVCIIAVLLRKKIIMKPIFLTILITLILIFSTQFGNILNFVLSRTYYNVYINNTCNFSDLNKSAFILNGVIYILMYMAYKYKLKDEKKIIFYLNIQGISLLCIAMGSIMSLFMRISFFFSILQIISVPYIVYDTRAFDSIIFEIKNKKIILTNKILQLTFLVIVLTIYTCNIIHNNFINNVGEVVPYKIVFNKK
ncbi:MAG: EpsG family protein [Clostridia bacterium]|nr:EpsG family protein [Clostridia bacterium]